MKLSLFIVVGYAALNVTSTLICAAAVTEVTSCSSTPAEVAQYLYSLVGDSGLHVAQYLDNHEKTEQKFISLVPISQDQGGITGLSMIRLSMLGNNATLTFNIHNGSQIERAQCTIDYALACSRASVNYLQPDDVKEPVQAQLSCNLRPAASSVATAPHDHGLKVLGDRFIAAVSDDKKTVSCAVLALNYDPIMSSAFKAYMEEILKRSRARSLRC